MKTLLEDVFILENLRVVNEGRKSGPMVIEGTFQRADEENNNKRIYPKALLQREMKKLAPAIAERRLLGELDHPQHDSVRLNNVSHLITGLRMEGTEVVGRAEILNTPAGKVAQALIEGGVKVGVSSRGLGTLSEDDNGKRYVNEDFQLVTWDLVADPSTRGAFPGLTESTHIQDIIDHTLPDAQKLKNFSTVLRGKLDENDAKKAYDQEKSLSRSISRAGLDRRARQVQQDQRNKKIQHSLATSKAPRASKNSAGKHGYKAGEVPNQVDRGSVVPGRKKRYVPGPKGKLPDHTELATYLRDKLDELDVRVDKTFSNNTRRYSGKKANTLYKQAKKGNKNPKRPEPRDPAPNDENEGDRIPSLMTHGSFVTAKLTKNKKKEKKDEGQNRNPAKYRAFSPNFGAPKPNKGEPESPEDRQKTLDRIRKHMAGVKYPDIKPSKKKESTELATYLRDKLDEYNPAKIKSKYSPGTFYSSNTRGPSSAYGHPDVANTKDTPKQTQAHKANLEAQRDAVKQAHNAHGKHKTEFGQAVRGQKGVTHRQAIKVGHRAANRKIGGGDSLGPKEASELATYLRGKLDDAKTPISYPKSKSPSLGDPNAPDRPTPTFTQNAKPRGPSKSGEPPPVLPKYRNMWPKR